MDEDTPQLVDFSVTYDDLKRISAALSLREVEVRGFAIRLLEGSGRDLVLSEANALRELVDRMERIAYR